MATKKRKKLGKSITRKRAKLLISRLHTHGRNSLSNKEEIELFHWYLRENPL